MKAVGDGAADTLARGGDQRHLALQPSGHFPPHGFGVQRGEACFLPYPSLVEVIRSQPPFKRRLARRPFAIQHGEPRGVAVTPLDDHVLAKQPLVGEAEARRGAVGRRVEHVALPFITPVTELLEDVARQQVHRLGRKRRALQSGAVADVADLDNACIRPDLHQGCHADGASFGVHDREIVGVRKAFPARPSQAANPAASGNGPNGYVRPQSIVVADRLPHGRAVARGIELFNRAETAGQRHRPRPRRRRWIGDRQADRLAGGGVRFGFFGRHVRIAACGLRRKTC